MTRSLRTALALFTAAFAAAAQPASAGFVYMPAEDRSTPSPTPPAPATTDASDVEDLAHHLATALAARGFSPAEPDPPIDEPVVSGPRPGCGFSTATDFSRDDAYWLLCGEPLIQALGRWGTRDGVLVVWGGDPGSEDDRWRVRVDYRFRAPGFAGALAQVETMPWGAGRPSFHLDEVNAVLTVFERPRHGPH